MQKPFARRVAEYRRRSNRRRVWKGIVRVMAYVVVFCTTYALILPAITLEQQYSCGLEAHIHSQACYTTVEHPKLVCGTEIHKHGDGCYDGEGVLTCAQEEFLLHTHDHFCYDGQGALICALAQTAEHTHTRDCYGFTGHRHDDSCYTGEQGALSCQLPEADGHKHDKSCYTQTTELTCQSAQTEGHTHCEDCFVWELTCGKAESEGHVHGDTCFETVRTLTCEKEESTEKALICTLPEIIRSDATQAHQHSAACVEITREQKLICPLEEHTHDLSCNSDPNADVETAQDWEKAMEAVVLGGSWSENLAAIAQTQVGYAESTKNYLTEDNRTKQGYTRYGAWYGTPYGDWDAMFASFCLHYAGIPVEAVPHASDPGKWAQTLEAMELLEPVANRMPQPGDLLFFADGDGNVTGVEIVVGLDMENGENGTEAVSGIKTIGGDREKEVSRGVYDPEEPSLYACCAMEAALLRFRREYPEKAVALGLLTEQTEPIAPNKTVPGELLTQTAQTENYIVSVTYSAALDIPQGTELRVTEYPRDSEIFRRRCEEAGYELEWLLNIGFFLGEEEVNLAGAFDVVVTSKQGNALGSDITHFGQSGTQRLEGEDTTGEAEAGQSSVSFCADGFSDFGGGTAAVAATEAAGLRITAAADDEDNLKKSKHNNATPTDSAWLSGVFTNGNDAYIRYNSSENYTIQSGDVATIRLKFNDIQNTTDGNVGTAVFVVQVTGATPNEVKQGITVAETDDLVTVTMALDSIAGRTFNWLQVKWSGAAGATMSYEIESIRIGQPSQAHKHDWAASGANHPTCASPGSAVTYTCSCGEAFTVDPASLTGSIKAYANALRSTNSKDDYSKGNFTWDTEGKTWSWTYFNGVMMDAFLKVGTDEMLDYVVAFYDDVLDETGLPKNYHTGEVDSVPPAMALFDLLGTNDEAQNQRYVTAIQYVFDQLWNHQTTLGSEYGGNFLHKASWTTYRFGLDGVYMALPFLMEYANALDRELLTNSSVTSNEIYATIYSRLNWVANTMYDADTGLYHHGWNGSQGNGQFWGRGIGWYAVALVDIIEKMPQSYRAQLTANLTRLFDGMLAWQDADTGMWYNVVNRDDTLTAGNGNRLETSVSSMMAYAMMKAYGQGWVDAKYYAAGLRALNGVVVNKMENGAVTGTYRSSSVCTTAEDYLKNPYTSNEAKGVGALIMAAAPDHNWTEWTVSTRAAAGSATTETRRCSTCNVQQSRTISVAAEEETPIGYTLTVVDPTQLEAGQIYAIYSAQADAAATYNFLMATQKNPPNVPVDTTSYQAGGYVDSARIIGQSWYVPASFFSSEESFTYTAEPQAGKDKVFWLGMRGFDDPNYNGPEYLFLNDKIDSYYSGGGPNRLDLTISRSNDTDGAATVVRTNATGNQLALMDGKWTATATATPVYFARVAPVYAQSKPIPTEVHELKVLGINGPVVGKTYVIYLPDISAEGTVDVKLLGSTVNPGKGNYSRGINDVENSPDTMRQAGSTWTLELYEDSGFTFEEVQWRVAQVNGDLCLQSAANPELYLKLVCTSDKGFSQVNSTAYDEQGASHFALDFASGKDESDSWYTITSVDGSYALRVYDAQNQWQAIRSDLTDEGTGEAITPTRIYLAQVDDDTENPGTTTQQKLVGYDFTTLDPNKLYDGQIVTIYTRPSSEDPDTYTFVYAQKDVPAVTVADTTHNSYPSTVDATWHLTTEQMGSAPEAFTWKVERRDDGSIWLAAQGYDHPDYEGPEYLCIQSGKVCTWNNTGKISLQIQNISGAGCQIYAPDSKKALSYTAGSTSWTPGETGATMYFASVSPVYRQDILPNNYPEAVETGSPSVDTLRFYNFVESGGEHIAALPGCRFVIRGVDTDYTYTITSSDNPEMHLPADIPVGSYTIEEVSSADGYLRDVNPKRGFTVTTSEDGRKVFGGTTSIGTYLNHAQNLLGADKVAEVEDYNNRTYQIMLTAESNLRLYEMNPVDVLFVVDQSNSMLFPAGLTATSQTVTIYPNADCSVAENKRNPATGNALDSLVQEGKLSKDQVYYIIADPKVTSTVYAVWHNGVDWMYQDASYYAKAWHENADGYQQDDEYAVFPDVASYDEQSGTHVITVNGQETEVPTKANGGSLSYSLGTKNAIASDIVANGGQSKTYTLYTATNGYNRLHYLQDALAHSIHQLADSNPESTVTLIRFNRVTLHEQCIGPWKLSPDNVQKLVEAVDAIRTDGGTRQDIALKHTHDHLTGKVTWYDEKGTGHTEDAYTKGAAYTFTVLITDGAPVGSGGDILNLGTADDLLPTDAQIEAVVEAGDETGQSAAQLNQANGVTIYSSIKYWGNKVGILNYDSGGESILMTIGLGMGAVDGGAQVLGEIATGGKTGGNHLIIDNAEQLMDMLKKLLFSSMVPREKVDLMGDITDVISNSFYPIAWVPKGQCPEGRSLLAMKDPQDAEKDWIILEDGDWITCEGQYVGPKQTAGNLYGTGQLCVNPEGDFQITWEDQMLYDCQLVWVPARKEVPSGRQIVMAEETIKVGDTACGYGRYWFKLVPGDQVYAHGEYVSPGKPKSGTVPYGFVTEGMTYQIVGKYVQNPGDHRAHIDWLDYYSVDFDANFQPFKWHGKFFVKAREDFIGGNAIDTNKSAQVKTQANDGDNIEQWQGTITLETPTVNVRLLDMNQMESEVTVYLGDTINSGAPDDPLASPLDSLKAFFEKTRFQKLHPDHAGKAAVMNKVETADGLHPDSFCLNYAMGGLTAEQWARLAAGESVTVPYTYDNASSHGPVGSFTFRLEKTGKTADYEAHEATDDCQVQHTHDQRCTEPVETYTLHVTYTAYALGESGRPASTVHNDTEDMDSDGKNAGTEVSEQVPSKRLEEGYGVVDKANVHRVHVISGAVWIQKEIDESLKSDTDQTFLFTLHRQEDVQLDEHGQPVLDESGNPVPDPANDRTLTVTIPAGQTTGSANTSGLKRGTWLLTEATSEDYSVREIIILATDENGKRITNCHSESGRATATFHMGFDWEKNQNVIGKVVTGGENSHEAVADYTSYTGTPNGVYGAAKIVNQKTVYTGEVPVEKLWFDGSENHTQDEVLLVLYENGTPARVDDKIQYLFLNGENSWKGTFTVYLSGASDTVQAHSYCVKEAVVTDLTQEQYEALREDAKASYLPLVMVSGEETRTVYARVAEHQTILSTGSDAWFVQYGTKQETMQDGTTQTVHTVTNSPARVLPESGGMGTQLYTFSGLLCVVLAALMYGYSHRRKRERGAAE